MTFEQWLAFGVANGYCSEQVCETHTGTPLSETEIEIADELDGGDDYCVHIVRLGNNEIWEADAKAFKDTNV